MYADITGIILSGGRSKRMGHNKSFLVIHNRTVIERIAGLMQSVFSKVILITNTPAEYKMLGLDTYEDIHKNTGPLAGIHSGLVNSKTEKNFIISCDVPVMTEKIIRYIADYKTDKKITVCIADGYLQPLAGIYHKSLADSIESSIRENTGSADHNSLSGKTKCRLMHFIENSGAEILNPENTEGYTGNEFFNLNTPENYQYILKMTGNSGD
jgi:molybdopterin-guanine dinucleotide biosynthesis protein A